MSSLTAEVQRMARNIENYLNKGIKNIGTDLMAKYTNLMAKRYDETVKKAASNFYSGYSPRMYKRTNALSSIHDIQAHSSGTSGQVIITFRNSLPGHQSGELIYDVVFKQGYHGGSWGTDQWGDSRGAPYYRQPAGKYTFWGSPAKKSIAPFDEIMEELPLIDAELQASLDEEGMSRIMALFRSIGL